MAKYIDLSKAQKEEIRRLTQLANRRIKAAFKAYEKEGLKTAPRDVVGDIQIREQWSSEKYALSRSVKFATQKEYREQLHMLQRFERSRPGIKEYTEIQRQKTLEGVETSMGIEVPSQLAGIINKLSAPQLSKFWNKFSDVSTRMGMQYSSTAALDMAATEFFKEDAQALSAGLASDIKTQHVTFENMGKKAPKKKVTKKKAPKKKKV